MYLITSRRYNSIYDSIHSMILFILDYFLNMDVIIPKRYDPNAIFS